MIKKLALLAAAAVVYTAVPASAQGISVQVGGGYHRDHGFRDHGYRHSRAQFVRRDRGYHRGWDRHPRGRVVIVR